MADQRVFPKLLGVQAAWTVVATILATATACVVGGVSPVQTVVVTAAAGGAAVLSCAGAAWVLARRLSERTAEVVELLNRLANSDWEVAPVAQDLTVSSSQLIKILNQSSIAWIAVNRKRTALGKHAFK